MTQHWREYLRQVPGLRLSEGNLVKHLTDDDRAVEALWKHIGEARRHVWVSMYLLAPDAVGLGTVERLAAAARRGCEVLLLYDHMGSSRLRAKHLQPLRDAGAQVAVFNRSRSLWRRTGRFGIRNHRKLVLIDGEAAVCGGMNLSAAFTGNEYGDLTFDDTVVFARGPCVGDLADLFLDTWEEATGTRPHRPPRPEPHPHGIQAGVLGSDPRDAQAHQRRVLEEAVARSRERCRLVTPAFIPPDRLSDALPEAAGRGVDVQVLTTGTTDVPLVRAAGRSRYGALVRGGVHIYELFGRRLHATTVTIDGAFGVVGAYDMDLWTSRHVLDASLVFADERLARSLEHEFETFKRNASAYTLKDYEKRHLPTRTLHWAALQLASRL